MDDKYIVRYKRVPQVGAYDAISSFIQQKQLELNLEPIKKAKLNKNIDTLMRKALYRACEDGDFLSVKSIAETHQLDLIAIDLSYGQGDMLKKAAASGNIDLVCYLIEVHNLDVEDKEWSRETALCEACNKGHRDVALYLLSMGADPNMGSDSQSVLVKAIYSKNVLLVQDLVHNGAIINAWAIYYALTAGVFEISQFLLEKNTQVDLSKGHVGPFVQAAAKGGCLRTLQLLVNHYNLDLFERDRYDEKLRGYGILISAAESGSVELVRHLVEVCGIDISSIVQAENKGQYAYSDAYRTILGTATWKNSLPLVKYIVEELNLLPPTDALKTLKQNASGYSCAMDAYFESYLVDSADTKALLLRVVEHELTGLSLEELLTLYRLRLPTENAYSDYRIEIGFRINSFEFKTNDLQLWFYSRSPQFSIDLLNYFVTQSDKYGEQINVLSSLGVSGHTNDMQGNGLPQSATSADQNHQTLEAAVVEMVTHYLAEKPSRSKDDLYEIAPPTTAHQNYSMFVKSNPADANAKKMDASSTKMEI